MVSSTDEFWNVPIPVWNLGATLLLALLTGVYVVLTGRAARSGRVAALAALASVDVDLQTTLYVTPPDIPFDVVELTNRGASLFIHRAEVRDFDGKEAAFNLEPVES